MHEVIRNKPFIHANCVALIESIRSCYNDPTDSTCNGDLRFRAFFLMPNRGYHLQETEFLIKQLEDGDYRKWMYLVAR